MATTDEDRQSLSRLFQRRKIADRDQLFAALDKTIQDVPDDAQFPSRDA